MLRVLVIEDDGETAAEIVEDFSAAGFAVPHESDGPSGRARAPAAAPAATTGRSPQGIWPAP